MSKSILNKMGFGIPAIIIDCEDYLSLTSMCKDTEYKPKDKIRNYLSNPTNLRYIFALERALDPKFTYIITKEGNIFDASANIGGPPEAPLSSPEHSRITGQHKIRAETLISTYGVRSLYIKKGGKSSGQGTYAHHLIALHFATWLDAEYGLYVNWDYERLKSIELDNQAMEVGWFYDRDDARLSHRMLENLVIQVCIPAIMKEADVEFTSTEKKNVLEDIMITLSEYINIKVFNQTSVEWRKNNPNTPGNMRDYATKTQLLKVAHLERAACAVIGEHPLNQKKWMESLDREAFEYGVRLSRLDYFSDGKVYDESLLTGSNPFSHDARTMTSLESMQSRFLKELSAGEVHQSDDGYFRNNEGYIILAPKFK